uniref:Uncharacterized protein n=1 Tax=Anopheles atroparvus TaxID=41427 RepID=A0AAG5CPZ3_ANOAO
MACVVRVPFVVPSRRFANAVADCTLHVARTWWGLRRRRHRHRCVWAPTTVCSPCAYPFGSDASPRAGASAWVSQKQSSAIFRPTNQQHIQ